MRTTTRAALLSLALASLPTAREALADPPPAHDAKSDEASQRFKSGVASYKDKDFTAALVDFKRAYELLPNYNVLYNLGQTARELKDYAAALSAFERYLRDGGAKISPARRKEVSAAVDDLRKRVGKITLKNLVDGTEIAVDDLPVGVSPLAEPMVVNAGRHKLSVTASGYAPLQRMVDVASMEEATVSLELVKIETAAPRVEPPPPEKKGPPLFVWGALAGTAALTVGASVTGGLAVAAHGSLKTALGTFPGNPATISAAQSKTRTFAEATDVLGGFAVAGAAATVVLYVMAPRLAEKVTVGVSPAGVVVGGAFCEVTRSALKMCPGKRRERREAREVDRGILCDFEGDRPTIRGASSFPGHIFRREASR